MSTKIQEKPTTTTTTTMTMTPQAEEPLPGILEMLKSIKLLDPLSLDHAILWVEILKLMGVTATSALNAWTKSRPQQECEEVTA